MSIDTNPATGNIDAAIAAGISISKPQPLDDDGRFFAQAVPAGAKVEVHDLNELRQQLADHPPRKRGTVKVHDADAFIRYIAKHGLDATEVWANQSARQLIGVINAHAASDTSLDEGIAGHGDHRVELELISSPEWNTWLGLDTKYLNQVAFAEHLEDHAIDVIPALGADAATMLEIAQSFHASSTGAFGRTERLDNGSINLLWEETVQARAGQSGEITIPSNFTIAIPPFVGAELVEITARFRYRIREGNLALSYALLNADLIQRTAFLEMVDAVTDAIEPPVFLGRPA
ncbi:YfdQ family protein [Nocardioides carbamazepini]|uniref:YfdQ family protein n=1 Tax=Nocardioides carbamazepini TaxID=2854259 RepID=UPI002149B491|nr:YfdQ family protein [Nocardioides carbamazepini]MCR1785352.1 YfdQ family protein [Nocardioides carbamazepini]